jgi:quinol monooxygenase YgiN
LRSSLGPDAGNDFSIRDLEQVIPQFARAQKKGISIFRWIARCGLNSYGRSVSKLAVLISGRTQPGKRDEVHRLFAAHLAPRAIANPSQPIVVWCADNGDPDAFYLWEVYTDPAAMEANGRAPWFGLYIGAVGPLLAGQPEVMTATPMWVKPALS